MGEEDIRNDRIRPRNPPQASWCLPGRGSEAPRVVAAYAFPHGDWEEECQPLSGAASGRGVRWKSDVAPIASRNRLLEGEARSNLRRCLRKPPSLRDGPLRYRSLQAEALQRLRLPR